jgi:hypothetical protein
LSDNWDYSFLGVAFYVSGGEYNLVRVVYLVSFDMKQAVELKNSGFELGAFSIEEVRLLNFDSVFSVGVAWLRGVYRGVTYLEGVQSVKVS